MRTLLLLVVGLTGCPDYTVKSMADQPQGPGGFPDYPDDSDDDDTEDDAWDTGEDGPPVDTGFAPPKDPDEEDPPPGDDDIPERCNGEDDDGDGLVDEDFTDTDGDGIADCVDTEECDGQDNDGDGTIDEGFDEDHDGTADCLEHIYEVDFHVTVDDYWEGTIDGEPISASSGWSGVDTFEWDLDSGDHVITVHGEDRGEAIAAFLGSVVIDGSVIFVTGDGSWRMSDSGPAPGWLAPGFPSSAWDVPVPCTDLGPWGDWSGLPLDHGAQWVWYHPAGDCRAPGSYGEAWFRLEFNLP